MDRSQTAEVPARGSHLAGGRLGGAAASLNASSAPALTYRVLRPAYDAKWGADYYARQAAWSGYTEAARADLHAAEMRWTLRMMNGLHDNPPWAEGLGDSLWKEYQTAGPNSYNSSRPGYFALQAGRHLRGPKALSEPQYTKLCVSNSTLHAEVVARAMKGLVEPGGALGIAAEEDDGGSGFCTCDRCRALDRAGALPPGAAWDGACKGAVAGVNSSSNALSERYVYFQNAIHDEMLRRLPNRTDLWTSMYAYDCYKDPPVSGLKLRPRSMAVIVTFDAYPHNPETPPCLLPPCLTDRERWLGWGHGGAGADALVLRPNSLYYLGYGLPFEVSEQLASDYQFCGDNLMRGSDFDSLIGNWATVGPAYYVLGRAMWRPASADTSIVDLYDEYYGAFGAGAGAVRAYWDYWSQFTANVLGSPAAFAARAALGEDGNMKIAATFYSNATFAAAGALLARAAAATAGDAAAAARVAFLQLGLEHGQLTYDAYFATNTSLCSKGATLVPDEPGYYRGWSTQFNCDVRTMLPAAQRLLNFRKQHATSGATNAFYNSYAEQYKCKSGCTGINLGGDANAAAPLLDRPLLALSDHYWYVAFDEDDVGVADRWFDPRKKMYNRSLFSFEISTLQNWTTSKQDAAWRAAHDSKGYTGVGWYLIGVRCPFCGDIGSFGLTFSGATGPVQAWFGGVQVTGGVRNATAGGAFTLGPFESPAGWVNASALLAVRVGTGFGLDGRVWVVDMST